MWDKSLNNNLFTFFTVFYQGGRISGRFFFLKPKRGQLPLWKMSLRYANGSLQFRTLCYFSFLFCLCRLIKLMTHRDLVQKHYSLLLNRIACLNSIVIFSGPTILHILHLNSEA